MTLYVDTSLLVAALTIEPESKRIQAWLEQTGREPFSISSWVIAEFSSALSVKQRTGEIDDSERAATLVLFRRMVAETFVLLPVLEFHLQTAARFVEQPMLALRAPDGLHLAICSSHGQTLCTLDRRLAQAGTALGVSTLLV